MKALGGVADPPAGWGEFYLARNQLVFATLRSVFPQVLAVPSQPLTLLASERQVLTLDEESLLRHATQRRLGEFNLFAFTDSMQVQRVAHEWRPGRPFNPLEMAPEDDRLVTSPRLINTDAQPTAYFLSGLLWVRLSDERRAQVLEAVHRAPSWLFGALALTPLLLLPLVRWKPQAAGRWRPLLAVIVMGLVGMGGELVLLLAFQARFGRLYQQVGSLFALFMLGLVVGSWLMQRQQKWLAAQTLALLLLISGVLMLALLWGIENVTDLPDALTWGVYGAAMGMLGGLVGAAYPATVRALTEAGLTTQSAAGLAYAYDLLDGVLGALLVGILLLPLHGIPFALTLLATLCLTTSIIGSYRKG